jgi:mono/diheme cytochrome c family protein
MNELRKIRLSAAVAAAVSLLAAGGGISARADGSGLLDAGSLDTQDGGEIYRQICQGCHMQNGQGAIGAGRYPALAKDPALASAEFMALTILDGRRNMPSFKKNAMSGFFFSVPTLTDEQVAAVINYVRTHFGNDYKGLITAAQVKALQPPR